MGRNNEAWEFLFQQLMIYKNDNGNFKVPLDYIVVMPDGTERKLYTWTQAQRTAYKNKTISKDRKKKLQSIGFDFAPHSRRWGQSFAKMKKSIEKGTYPKSVKDWVSWQRQMYFKGELSEERQKKLKAVNPRIFYTAEDYWLEKHKAVKAYTDKGKKVPQNAIVNGCLLTKWITRQKNALAMNGFPKWKEEKLQEIGVTRTIKNNLAYDMLGERQFTDEQSEIIEQGMTVLNDRERHIIQLYYEERYTLQKCSEIYDVSREYIRQIKQKAIRKLHKYLDGEDVCEKKVIDKNSIDFLGLSVRAYNALSGAGITTIPSLRNTIMENPDTIIKLKNVGVKTQKEIFVAVMTMQENTTFTEDKEEKQ